MIRVVHPGFRILKLTFSHPGSWIPDPGVKKVPNPGSATLPTSIGKTQYHSLVNLRRKRQSRIKLQITVGVKDGEVF